MRLVVTANGLYCVDDSVVGRKGGPRVGEERVLEQT